MATRWQWFRRTFGVQPGEPDPSARSRGEDLVLLLSESSAPLGAMYLDLLRKANIPVLPVEWGGGSALVGGAPPGVRLYVPRSRLVEAREILGLDQQPEALEAP